MNKEVWRAIKFLLFSMSAGLIQTISFALLNEFTGWRYWPCYLIALALSVVWNFTLNRRFTFKSTANVPVAMFKVICYYAVFTPLSTWGGDYLSETLHWNEYLVLFICMFVNLVTEFLFQRYVVYGKKVDNRDAAKVTAVVALLALSATAFAGEEEKVEGWNFGVLPCVSYNSDLGLQYGVCADIFNYGKIYPDYRQRMYVEASRYTGGQTLLHGQFDSRYLIPGIRTTFSASYQYDPMFLFYGLNGLEAYDKSRDANTETREARYAYKRSMVRVLADFQGPIVPHLNWVGGVSYWYYGLGDIDFKKKDKETKERYEVYDSSKTLYHQMCEAGVFEGGEATGGHRLEMKAGLVLDTRDNESAPNRGLWAEAYLNGSPDFFGDGYNYLRLAAHLRQYLSLWPDRMVFAYHLAYQGVIAGQAPFYGMQNISTLFLRQTCTDGLGGINTVRGLLAQRLVGDSYAWMNSELRIRMFDFKFIGQNWYVATNPLFDAGMVTRLYKGEELSRFYGRSVDDLKAEALKLHCSAGAGLKLVMNTNFIVSAEWAKPFKKTDGDSALYIALNYIF